MKIKKLVWKEPTEFHYSLAIILITLLIFFIMSIIENNGIYLMFWFVCLALLKFLKIPTKVEYEVK